ncbi:MAG: pantoate--beta-alanine ligase, partial [Proteobacteria bacterium]|nr:pantoate--beta-alanine ligase [Pseudomonadota bacterium]
ERSRAPHLKQSLDNAARLIGQGRPARQVLEDEIAALSDRGFEVDYLALVDGATLEALSDPKPEARLLVAAHLGSVRLIDNRAL